MPGRQSPSTQNASTSQVAGRHTSLSRIALSEMLKFPDIVFVHIYRVLLDDADVYDGNTSS